MGFPLRRNKGMQGTPSGTAGHSAPTVTIGDQHTNHQNFQFPQRAKGAASPKEANSANDADMGHCQTE